jgi:hypothetical protein
VNSALKFPCARHQGLALRETIYEDLRRLRMNTPLKRTYSILLALLYGAWFAPMAQAYSFFMVVPDVRQPAAVSGGSACPLPAHQLTATGSIAVQWSTALSTSSVTIITQNQTASGRQNEIAQSISQAISVWTAVSGTTLLPATFTALTTTATQNACGPDGLNTICFDQADSAFTPGVLAFARIISTDVLDEQVGSSPKATQLGQILDADIYFNPSDSSMTFATPQALPASPASYDLESLLLHEFGHFLGFGHSAVWSAIMFPFAQAPGTFAGTRPTTQQPDAPLGDDDRTGLRVLYADPADTMHIGSIQGRILPANPLALPLSPPGVTGVFGAEVVAVDQASGAVAGATFSGWSCASPGPAQFDGTYQIDALSVGHSYSVYAEALNGAVAPSQISSVMGTLCRNAATDPGWPSLQACEVPAMNTSLTTRTLPGP